MMSETSTPSMNLHPISPTSSLSSADSAPHSDPTSDEQPDLGAFTTVLREFTHLQPGPRIPVQRRAATSSTTPTFQPTEPSEAGSVQSSSYRPTSSYRRRRVPSSQSTFTRPPSSSAAPEEGSTVWDHGLIANYLLSATPSNDYDLDDYYELDAVDEEGESQYNPSPPNSLNSTSLTVEINSESDVPTTDNESIRVSPYPHSDGGLLVPVQGPGQRLNSRESHYPHEERATDDASTYRIQASSHSSHSHDSPGSYPSLQLKSQAPVSSSSSGTDVILSGISTTSSVQEHRSNAADSQSTTMSHFVSTVMNRSQNPIPPRTVYPSPNESYRYVSTSTSTSGSVSNASLTTQRPAQRLLQELHDSNPSPPLLNPHPPQPLPRPDGHDWRLSMGFLQGIVNDWGTPDQAPSETLVFEPPIRAPQFRPVVDDDNEEEIITNRQPASSFATVPHITGSENSGDHTYSNRQTSNLTATVTSTTLYSKHPVQQMERTIEPHNEDEEDEEDFYNHRFPFSHGYTPRYYGSALTPRGLPQRQEDPRMGIQLPPSSLHPSSHQATTSTTQEHDLNYNNATYTHVVSEPALPQSSKLHLDPQDYVQQNHRYQHLEKDKVTNPPSQHIDAQPLAHESERVLPLHVQASAPPTLSAQHHPVHPGYEPPSLYPQNQAHRDRPDAAASAKHGYPHSLLGMHALPASLQPPTPDDRPPTFLVEETPDASRVQSRLAGPETPPNLNASHTEAQSIVDSEIDNMPSLGALDEVLQFIAIERERARTNAVREPTSIRVNLDPDSEEHEDSADEAAGDIDWHNIVDNEQDQDHEREPKPNVGPEANSESTTGKGKEKEGDKEAEVEQEQELEQHRRRRRRKRPGKSNPAAAAATLSTDSVGTPSGSAVKESPSGRKRRRVRSSSRSAAAVLQTPGKDKEFLVDPSTLMKPTEKAQSQITILKRPSAGPSDDGHQDSGMKTPTNPAGRDMDLRNRDAFKDRTLPADDLQFDLEYDLADHTPIGAMEDDGGGNDTSFSNMALLQPPRRKRDKSARGSTKDAAYIHDILGGSYRSTPASPGRLAKHEAKQLEEEIEELARENPDVPAHDFVEETAPLPNEKKKRVRKHKKGIPHAKSVPDLKNETEQPETSPAATIANPLPGLSRAKSLGKQRQHATLRGRDPSDTQRDELERYLAASYNSRPGLFMMERREAVPQPDPNSKRGRLITLAQQLRQSFPEQNEDLSKLITRLSQTQGQKVKNKRGKGVFDGLDPAEGENDTGEEDDDVDTRGRSSKRSAVLTHVFIDHSNILIGLLTHIRRLRSKRQKFALKNPPSAFTTVKASNTRPLPLPVPDDSVGTTIEASQKFPIPLPSFATSRSLPTKSLLSSYMEAGASSLADESMGNDSISDDYEEAGEGRSKSQEKKQLTHLWHAALVLILERGRDVNRRVVVTSSPLYQPMDSIERLGYDLRVYLRVPDLGDGLDRERQKEKYGTKSSSSGMSAQSSMKSMSHMRQPSGNVSTDSGNDGVTNTTSSRVKYREQGVDELLQLKLHQALIATDQPPEGSTIVLATGDGNTGQFNEDGFLGAVRAALRKGWKVELYSWEYGLSSSWRREFGDFSRSGMFRIIYMEQFAASLLEANILA